MSDVFITAAAGRSYPATPPFHPGQHYPEMAGLPVTEAGNDAFEAVRTVLQQSGLDRENYGSPKWNPLGRHIRPGQTVLIKPNLVLDTHPRGGDLQCLVAHGSVVRAVAEYVLIALNGSGRLVIGDSPIQTTDFETVLRRTGVGDVAAYLRSVARVPVDVIDFRKVVSDRDEWGHIRQWRETAGDPAGYCRIDLGSDSMLAAISEGSDRFRVSNYEAADTRQYHKAGSHAYVIAKSVLNADVIISLPKLKTHCKVGVTLGMKNFVGTVGRKQCLAHHREGGAEDGGDEFPGRSRLKSFSEHLERRIDGARNPLKRSALNLLFRINERLIRELKINPVRDGGWYGNDTCWRMTLDLVRIAHFADATGAMKDHRARTVLTFVDGIVAGENEGPLEATPVAAGTVVFGDDIVAVDAAAAVWMGFEPEKIPLLRDAFRIGRWAPGSCDFGSVGVRVNGHDCTLTELRGKPGFRFAAPFGWRGRMELEEHATA